MQIMGSRATAIMAALMLLSACAVARPPVVTTRQATAPIPAKVAVDAKGPVAQAVMRDLVSALAARGTVVDPASDQILTIAASEHPAGMGVTLSDGLAVSPPRKHRWFDRCRAHRLTIGIMLRQAEAAQPQMMLSGFIDDCTIGASAIDRLTTALTAAM